MPVTIEIRTQFEGIHFWFDAPYEVDFLRSPHRHVFRVEVEAKVRTQDREVEFFMAKNLLEEIVYENFPPYRQTNPRLLDFGKWSCETLATWLSDMLANHMRVCRVTVREDDENSATVTR